MIVQNNFDMMNDSNKLESNIQNSESFVMRFNVEFLNGCQYSCPGCFVTRRNIVTDSDYSILLNIVENLRLNDIDVDEIILGPTDFFSAENSLDVITNAKFLSLFDNGTVLTILSTLQETDVDILKKISVINSVFDDIEIEILIPIDLNNIYDISYIDNLKSKISLLDNIKFPVDYALQINISSIDDINLEQLTTHIRDEFNTILEFNPSIMRISNIDKVKEFLTKWNAMLSDNINIANKNSVVLSSANKYHAGYNERTYTYKNGFLYSCPFIYENVISLTDKFKVNKAHEYYNIDEILEYDTQLTSTQFEYSNHTTECENCDHISSCISKQVLFYMENNSITECILNRNILSIHDINNRTSTIS